MNEVIFQNQRGKAVIMMIATGASHVLALDTAGNVYAWGSNNSGQLGPMKSSSQKNRDGMNASQHNGGGNNEEENKADTFSPFECKPKRVEGKIKDYEICQVYAGRAQSFAVTRTGKIFAWGDNANNVLGLDFNGDGENRKAAGPFDR